MDKETEYYYNNYFDLFRSQGWKQLISEFSENSESINSVENTKDLQDLFFRKGQLDIISSILTLETYIQRGFEDATTKDV